MTFDISKLAGDARRRGAENREILLGWMYKWGWSTTSNIQNLLGLKRDQTYTLIEQGVIERAIGPKGASPTFVIAEHRIPEALRAYENRPESILGLPYPWDRENVPILKLGRHNEVAQNIAILKVRQTGGIVLSDREIREQDSIAHPDFLVKDGESVTWHEVQLTSKYRERLYFQLQIREESRNRGDFNKIVWWCGTEGLARHMAKALSTNHLPKVIKRVDGKFVATQAEEGWRPLRLNSVSEIAVIPEQKKSAK